MDITRTDLNLLRRHTALPSDHGSWVFLLSPLLIGLFAGGAWNTATFYLVVAAFAAFLIRQPATIAVKVYSKRRARRELPAAWFWMAVYALVGLSALTGIVLHGFGYILILAIPGVPVFIWHLYLVGRRAERRQLGVELVASGVLALAAPAAYWVAVGSTTPAGWGLWALIWLQSAASIVYAYLRLEQRHWDQVPDLTSRIKRGQRALLYTSFNLLSVIILSLGGWLPVLLTLPYTLQWIETIWGTLQPAVGVKPARIGLRQLAVSSLFTILFILSWG